MPLSKIKVLKKPFQIFIILGKALQNFVRKWVKCYLNITPQSLDSEKQLELSIKICMS